MSCIVIGFQKILNKNARNDKDLFDVPQARNVLLYIIGIMAYKFGLETWLGSISVLAADRFPKENAFALLGALQGANQACQCIGSILIAPLVIRFPTNRVLAGGILTLTTMAVTLLICEAASGGTIEMIGSWDILGIFPIFLMAGIGHGMVELIRRIIPAAICGEAEVKLRKMDSLVHIFYEIAGTGGAFFSAFVILNLGSVYANFHVPFFWVISSIFWGLITLTNNNAEKSKAKAHHDHGILMSILLLFKGFFISIYEGGKIIFSDRRYLWLIPGYAFPLVIHRYLESQLAPAFAKHILKTTAYSQIMVGGSNFGELSGAFLVFLFTYNVHTPLPWVRWDGLVLNMLWILAYSYPSNYLAYAWYMALMCVFISAGWAAGDVSLSAFIQSTLSHTHKQKVSRLGAVMSFLYSTYIVIYACMSFGLGKVIDKFVKEKDPYGFLFWISGVMMSISCGLIVLSTFIPKGSCKFNPTKQDLGIMEVLETVPTEEEKQEKKPADKPESEENVNMLDQIAVNLA